MATDPAILGEPCCYLGTMTIVSKLILAAEDGKIDEAERKDLQELSGENAGNWIEVTRC